MATYDVSATGFSVEISSTVSFPAPFILEGLADDTDPLGFGDLTIAETGVTVNGDLIAFGKPQALQVTLAAVAGSPADNNLQVLLSARNSGIKETIDITASYPDGASFYGRNGVITSGVIGKGVSSAGRLNTRSYVITFVEVGEKRGK